MHRHFVPRASLSAIAAVITAVLVFGCGPLAQVRPSGPATPTQPVVEPTRAPTPSPTLAQPTAVPATPTKSSPDRADIRLEADGSGDYTTLLDALRAAQDGATITLGAGTYRLDSAYTITRSLTLVGAGADQTAIVSDLESFVVNAQAQGSFAASGITFSHEGEKPADVVRVFGSEVDVHDCRFTGGVTESDTGTVGSGLALEGVSGSVRDCEAADNGLDGILLKLNAEPTLEGNRCHGNGANGIAYLGKAAGMARRNECAANGLHGILVKEDAHPTLEENTCTENEQCGIGYFGRAAGEARGNECSGNKVDGVCVLAEAKPLLENNTLHDNTDSGIAYFDSAGGSARGNRCAGNRAQGIYVGEAAQPELVDNDCQGEPVVNRGQTAKPTATQVAQTGGAGTPAAGGDLIAFDSKISAGKIFNG